VDMPDEDDDGVVEPISNGPVSSGPIPLENRLD